MYLHHVSSMRLFQINCCKRLGKVKTSDILDECLQNRVWMQLVNFHCQVFNVIIVIDNNHAI